MPMRLIMQRNLKRNIYIVCMSPWAHWGLLCTNILSKLSPSGGNTLTHIVQCHFLDLFATGWIKKGQHQLLPPLFSTWNTQHNTFGFDGLNCGVSGIIHWDLTGPWDCPLYIYMCIIICFLRFTEWKQHVNTTWLCHPGYSKTAISEFANVFPSALWSMTITI